MVKKNMTKKKRKKTIKHKKNSNLWILPVFFILAIATIISLEYIKHKKGKDSFIFKKSSINIKTNKINKKVNKNYVSFDDKIQILFNKKRIQYTHFIDPTWKYHHYKIELENDKIVPIRKELEKLTKKNKGILREIEKIEKEQIYLYSISFNKKMTHKFLISALIEEEIVIAKIEKQKTIAKKNLPKIAFIIDDVGYHNTDANELKKLNIPITGSVIPNTPYAGGEGKKLYAFGLEMMIHLPMQAKDQSLSYPKNEFVVLSSTLAEIVDLIDYARKIIPHARGLNNHMGSLVTSNEEAISKVLTIVKKRGLFFVDSRTTTTTLAGKISRRMGIKTAEKDIFIDHIKTYEHSMEQIDKLIRIALYKGQGIAIGHPNSTTFRAIKDSIKKIRSKGINIVFVSKLLTY